jgi:hypothetical protein
MARQIGEVLRAQLLEGKSALSNDLLLQLLAKLVEVPASSDPKSNLEIALLDVALSGPTAEKPKPAKVMQEEVQAKPPVQIEPHPSTLRKKPVIVEEEETEEPAHISSETLDESCWPAVLVAVKQKHNTLYSIVRTTNPHFEAGAVTLECGFAFHQKKLNEKSVKKTLADVIQAVTGQSVRIGCILGQGREPVEIAPAARPLPPEDGEQVHAIAQAPKPKPETEEVKTISSIFGSAELLES